MRALPRSLHLAVRVPIAGVVAASLLVAVLGLGTASAADPRIEEAEQRTAEVQARLDGLLQQLNELEAEVEEAETELARLERKAAAEAEESQDAARTLAVRVRESYIRGNADPALQVLGSRSVGEAREQGRLLGILADRSRGEIEAATAARTRTLATTEQVEHAADELRSRQEELQGVQTEVAALLDDAKSEEQRVREVVAAEQAERERRAAEAARERAVRERADRSRTAAPGAGAAAPAARSGGGGAACPVGAGRSYSDTWGAARSGGRSHRGTDILAPRGTSIHAYESGTISRMSSNSLGGISLYLRGNSGTVYYYTHLQGYVAGLSTGQSVGAGQQIAYNGDTGNARGIPHLHFEVMPGGGGQVNPYPYVRRACG